MRAKRKGTATISAVQCKMARAALGLGVREIAALAGTSPDTIARLERGESLRPSTLARIADAIERAGVRLIGGSDGGAGVRLARPEGKSASA